ncbi:hypothetical protein BJ878DRAFT_524053 [Calycina marina]|uniref:Uncharacterized protein n=1 Tax=Calycina marina TaxID=1763456 RepID=A0A9P7YWS3_9HELO|nr:hypothetical protein BJ878DRAFT_524053 [Calycina marina]
MVDWPREKCRSGLHHDTSVEGGLLHYLGCLEFQEREDFFNSLPEGEEKLKNQISDEQSRILRLRDAFEADGDTTGYGRLLGSFKTALAARFKAQGKKQYISPPPRTAEQSNPLSTSSKIGDLDDLNANIIYFKDHEPYSHPDFPGVFPNQKVPLSLLLRKDENANPLMWKCEENMIRYFHIPANNMAWVEEVIARYYREDKPDLDGPYRKPNRGEPQSKTRMLLRPQFWRGLQHGNRKDLPVHTRHMRPRCYVVSTDHKLTEPEPRNIVCFMPYLHWETDRRRARAAVCMKRTSNAQLAALDDVVDATATNIIEGTIERATSDGLLYNIPTQLKIVKRKTGTKSLVNKAVKGQTMLGRLLLIAAALYEAMDAYTDEKLIERYLNAKPPLQPRRTLDQSYYWTLKDTRKRDRDQVVYRATAPSPEIVHHKHFKGVRGNKTVEDVSPDGSVKQSIRPKSVKEAFADGSIKRACRQCTEDARRVPRVIMVDQLWMWVLDENTVITSFPRRWGHNKPDPSAVQKLIRTRIQQARDDEIRSVYDLGVIIIDQCSRVFFDRTESIDMQPQVMDSFGNAIGKVSHQTTIAFDHFWEYTRLSSKKYNAQEEGEPETRALQSMQKTMLDINPEGQLLREIKDILDELFIMTQIKNQETTVARTFVKLVQHIMQPSSTNGSIRNHSNNSLPEIRTKRPSLKLENSYRPAFHESDAETNLEFTMNLTADLMDSLQDQLQELGYLKDAGERTEAALKDLMELKQQQAGVVEAREAVKQGEESLKQGRSIMLFTVVTIIFLPLSFFASIFGMNAVELTGEDGNLHIKDIFIYMIPLSFGVITLSLFLAFSKMTRALLSFACSYIWTLTITRTPLYTFWHNLKWHDKHMSSKTLMEQEAIVVNRMKIGALRKRAERAEERKMLEEGHVEEFIMGNDIDSGRVSGSSRGNGLADTLRLA